MASEASNENKTNGDVSPEKVQIQDRREDLLNAIGATTEAIVQGCDSNEMSIKRDLCYSIANCDLQLNLATLETGFQLMGDGSEGDRGNLKSLLVGWRRRKCAVHNGDIVVAIGTGQ